MERKVRIAGIAGSLREKSYNKAALRAVKELLPENVELEILDLSDIPMFNEDVEAEGTPDAVANFKEKLEKSDALLIATPEYNFSIPAVLKNALDWASRGKDSPLNGKPVAIMSASPSLLGGARVQYHLRQVCVSVNLYPINKPEVFIASAHKKFNEDGVLIDDRTKKLIKNLVETLVERVK